jgi:hypothetical protein
MNEGYADVLSLSHNLQLGKFCRVLIEQSFFKPMKISLLTARLNQNCEVDPSPILG